MGPVISGLVSSSNSPSVHMPYTSLVLGNTMRLLKRTQSRTMRRFSSKSSSNTRSGLRTYSIGVAMATSGRITSHLRTWNSTHSRLMLMSPSTKWKRGWSATEPRLSLFRSMPYTS